MTDSNPAAPARRSWPENQLAVIGVIALGLALAATALVVKLKDTGESGSGGAGGTVQIELTEFKIGGQLSVPAGPVKLQVVNKGSQAHNLTVEKLGKSTKNLDAGASETLDLGNLEPGTYDLRCTVSGHTEAGMTGTLTVTEGGSAPAEADMASGSGHGSEADMVDGTLSAEEYTSMSDAMDKSVTDYLGYVDQLVKTGKGATKGLGNQPLEPKVENGVKVFDLTASIIDWETEPGKVVKAWAYNGQVPGPLIHVDLGDKVKIRLKNDLPMATDLHLHGVRLQDNAEDGVAPLTQDRIDPGTSFDYDFTADEGAVAMYHAHHHGDVQVINGLFAPLVIGDLSTYIPRGKTIGGRTIPADVKVAREIQMVLNDAGNIGLSLNGKSFPATEPYVFNKGDWYLVNYYNEGLQVHPMHQHQLPQLVIAKDGIPLEQPYWMDTLAVAPGERYTVLTSADTAGAWVWHCHILTHVERSTGLFGMATAVVVQ